MFRTYRMLLRPLLEALEPGRVARAHGSGFRERNQRKGHRDETSKLWMQHAVTSCLLENATCGTYFYRFTNLRRYLRRNTCKQQVTAKIALAVPNVETAKD